MAGELVGRDVESGRAIRIRWEDGRIRSVTPTSEAAGLPWVISGLVDLQVNGYAGLDVNAEDATPETCVELGRTLAHEGTTTFVPTVITAPVARICRAVEAVADACERDPVTAASVPFIHVEGPFISPEEGARGVHAYGEIRPPNVAELLRWQQHARGRIGMVTMSPHFPESPAFIRAAVGLGIRVAIGHTHASAEQIRAAVDAGARFATHLGNGIQAMLPRHPNAIWDQLAEDRLMAGVIADGHHLPAATLTSILRAKGLDRCFAVSDSAATSSLAPGHYTTAVGGEVDLQADGTLRVAGTPYLAGAALPLRAALDVIPQAGFSLRDAVRLTTTNPGRLAGGSGRLEPGMRADIVTFDLVEHKVQLGTVHRSGTLVRG